MTLMVQGNLLALTPSHAITAAKVGGITGLASVITLSILKKDSKWLNVILVGSFTTIADALVHPTHFGPELTEAVCTGLGAAVLAYIYHTFITERSDGQASKRQSERQGDLFRQKGFVWTTWRKSKARHK